MKYTVIRRLVRLEESRSLSVTLIVKVVSEKVFHLARIKVPSWHLDRIPIMGIRLFYLTISVQIDYINMECVSSMVTKLCAMTQLLPAWKIKYLKYTVFHRRPVGRWFPVGNWCVLSFQRLAQMGVTYSSLFKPIVRMLAKNLYSYSPQAGKISVSHFGNVYHNFAELRYRYKDKNYNWILIISWSLFWTLFLVFACKRMLSIIISKGIIISNNEYRSNTNKNM